MIRSAHHVRCHCVSSSVELWPNAWRRQRSPARRWRRSWSWLIRTSHAYRYGSRQRSPDSVCGVVFVWHALLCFRTSSAPPRGAMKISWAWWATTCAAWTTRWASSVTRSTRSSSPPRSDPSASAHRQALLLSILALKYGLDFSLKLCISFITYEELLWQLSGNECRCYRK